MRTATAASSLSAACALLLALLALLLAASAPAPAHASYLPPPPGINPIYIKLHLLSLSRIDGVSQTFFMDFFMLSMYRAPNPASTGLSCMNATACDLLSVDDIVAGKYWQPRLEFINSAGNVIALQDEPYSFAPPDQPAFQGVPPLPTDGSEVWIVSDQRYQGTFSTSLKMNAFPFDIQHLDMLLQTGWTSDQAILVYPSRTDADINAITASMSDNIGWTYMHTDLNSYNFSYSYNQNQFSRFKFSTTWNRQPQYYLTKIVAGMMLAVWMCIWNFSLQIDVSDRMMGTLQVFTGLISFLFVASGDTPKLPYQTRLDVFMMFSFFIVGFIMFIHGALYYFREQGFAGKKEERLLKLEKKKRKAFLKKARSKAGGILPGFSRFRGGGASGTAAAPGDKNAVVVLSAADTGKSAVSLPGTGSAYLQSPSGASSPEPTQAGVELHEMPVVDKPRSTPRSAFVAVSDDPATPAEVQLAGSATDRRASKPAGGETERKDDTMRVSTHARGASSMGGDHLSAQPMGGSQTPKGGNNNANVSDDSDDEDDAKHEGWEVRLNSWSTFSLSEWFAALACTRKWDAVCVPTLFLFYTIGCAAILGREPSDGSK